MILGVAALVAGILTILTAGVGFYLLARLVGGGGYRQPSSTRFPPALIVGQFLLAVAGLALWTIYFVKHNNPVGWTNLVGWAAAIVLATVGLLDFVMWGVWILIYRNRRETEEAADRHAGNLKASSDGLFSVPVVAANGVLAVATVILVVVAMLNAVRHETVAAANRVIAPDFENTTIARESFFSAGGSLSYSTEQAHSGTHSIKIVTGNDGGIAGFYLLPTTIKGANAREPSSAIKVQPGQKFYMECWVYPSASNTGGGKMALQGIVKDSTGYLGMDLSKNPERYVQAWFGPIPTPGQWTQISGHITIPIGYDLLWPDVHAFTDQPAQDTFYFDDAVVRDEK
jgi:manganese efflux pump family protein